MDDIQRFDIFDATFQPRRTDDLKPLAIPIIGWRGQWQAMWKVDSGEYAGQWAFGIHNELEQLGRYSGIIWIPQCDLVIHGLVDSLNRKFAY